MDAALRASRAPALRPALLRRQPAARRSLRALAEDDEALWTLPAVPAEASAEQRAAAKQRLVQLGAVTARGQAADFSARVDVEDAVLQLEALSPAGGSLEALTGRWSLVYASVELYRSSPFFWTFAAASQALLGSEEAALSIFRFTSSLPVAGARGPFGAVSLCFDLPGVGSGRFSSEVAMSIFDPLFGVFPGPSGVVITEGRLAGEGSQLKCTVESTRVEGSLSIPAVPVEQVFTGLRGGEAIAATARVGFLDESLLIIRTGEREDAILVYVRQ